MKVVNFLADVGSFLAQVVSPPKPGGRRESTSPATPEDYARQIEVEKELRRGDACG